MWCRTSAVTGGLHRGRLPFRQLLAVEVTNDARHVSLSLIIRRDAVILFNPLRAGVVGGQSLYQVKVVTLQQLTQVLCAAFDVGSRIESIGHSQLGRSLRHQLHQALRTLSRHGSRIESALGM